MHKICMLDKIVVFSKTSKKNHHVGVLIKHGPYGAVRWESRLWY